MDEWKMSHKKFDRNVPDNFMYGRYDSVVKLIERFEREECDC